MARKSAKAYGLGVLPYSPLAGGFLTGKYERDAALPDSKRAEGIANKRFTEQNWTILDKVREDCPGAWRTHPAQVALAWLLAKPYMTAPIVGANSVAQLRGRVARCGRFELSHRRSYRLSMKLQTGSTREPNKKFKARALTSIAAAIRSKSSLSTSNKPRRNG